MRHFQKYYKVSYPKKMNFAEKAIVKKVANVNKSVSKINKQGIIEFAQKINN
ncbi:MAG: hypothetical protein JSW07_14880 [bacterium]|nr:MAG: hypothetical protein JSW07_14880 [bacterium]